MAAPIFRRWTHATAAVNIFALATDDVTAETNYLLARNTELLDVISSPAPTLPTRFEIVLFKNGISTGRSFFTEGLDPASAGRAAIGPIDMVPGKLQFSVGNRAGSAIAYSFTAKLSNA